MIPFARLLCESQARHCNVNPSLLVKENGAYFIYDPLSL